MSCLLVGSVYKCTFEKLTAANFVLSNFKTIYVVLFSDMTSYSEV